MCRWVFHQLVKISSYMTRKSVVLPKERERGIWERVYYRARFLGQYCETYRVLRIPISGKVELIRYADDLAVVAVARKKETLKWVMTWFKEKKLALAPGKNNSVTSNTGAWRTTWRYAKQEKMNYYLSQVPTPQTFRDIPERFGKVWDAVYFFF